MQGPESAGLAAALMLALAFIGWVWSVVRRNVTIVDSLWPLFFFAALVTYFLTVDAESTGDTRRTLLLVLVTLWSARLSAYLTWRNAGKPEDRRYQAIRARNEPGYAWKSLYLVFALQAALAWIIAAPFYSVAAGSAPLRFLDMLGVSIWAAGFVLQVVGDAQLARFRSDPANAGLVLDRGLWRYTRHPNYFGEACMWWGYWLTAAAAGGYWTVFSPIVMTYLLLKVSGVALLEQDIGERRPAYADYVARTNAFVPGLRRDFRR